MNPSQKSIMILGAGIYQLPLIRKARERGFRTIVVSVPGPYPGFALADRACYVSTTDQEAILRIAREEKICAVATTGTDVAVISLGHVCHALSLPGPDEGAARILTDKALMKEAFRKGGVTTARFRRVSSYEEAVAAAEEIGCPVMLKIVDKSGSRGITKITEPSGIRAAWDYARAATNADHMVLEEFVSGHEIGIDAFVQGGRLKLILPHDKNIFYNGHTGIPMSHFCPMTCSEKLAESIRNETEKMIRSIGIDHCAVNIDAFVLPDERISIIEAAGRCGATGIPEVISGCTGRDYYDCILDGALGIPVPDFETREGHPTASQIIFSKKTGTLKEISYQLDGAVYRNSGVSIPGVGSVTLHAQPGDRVQEFRDGSMLIGLAVLQAESAEKLHQTVEEFRSRIKVEVET